MRALLLAFLLASQDQPPATCTLSGTVTNPATGAPLGKVDLLAQPVEERAGRVGAVASTVSDSKGNFTLIDLAPGRYRLLAVRNGFLETYYGAKRPTGHGTPITLEAGQEMKGLQLRLFPFGVIAGAVRDADGEPVAGATVKVFRQAFDESGRRRLVPESEGLSDDTGEYRIINLRPGKYFVRAEARGFGDFDIGVPEDHSPKSAAPPMALLPTLYPGVTDPAMARTVEVTSGTRTAGIDIPLARSRVFKVRVRPTAASGLAVSTVRLGWAHDFEELGLKLDGERKKDGGDFEIRGVPPGSYILTAGANPVQERHERAGVMTIDFFRREYVARAPLTVSGDTEGVRIAVNSGAEVTGRLTIEKEEAVAAKEATPPGSATVEISDSGAGFTLENMDGLISGSVEFVGRSGGQGIRTPLKEDDVRDRALSGSLRRVRGAAVNGH